MPLLMGRVRRIFKQYMVYSPCKKEIGGKKMPNIFCSAVMRWAIPPIRIEVLTEKMV